MTDSDGARILKLENDLAALTQQLAEVEQRLAGSYVGGFRSIRDSRRCPACGSGALLHVRRMKEIGAKGPIDASLAPEFSAFWRSTEARGPLEVYACRHCGIVEWHVTDFAEVPVDGTDIVSIEPEVGSPASGPFR